MKEIIINEKNISKIEKVLNDVQKNARVRTIDIADIISACEDIEKKFKFISKKALEDITFSIDINGQVFPNAYHGIPESTWFVCKYHGGKWRLTNVVRDRTGRNTNPHIRMTDVTKAAIIAAYEYGNA